MMSSRVMDQGVNNVCTPLVVILKGVVESTKNSCSHTLWYTYSMVYIHVATCVHVDGFFYIFLIGQSLIVCMWTHFKYALIDCCLRVNPLRDRQVHSNQSVIHYHSSETTECTRTCTCTYNIIVIAYTCVNPKECIPNPGIMIVHCIYACIWSITVNW